MPKLINPIVHHIQKHIDQEKYGPNGEVVIEALCCVSKIRYHNFMNMFKRPTISKVNILKMKDSKLVNDKLYKEYLKWCQDNEVAIKKEMRRLLKKEEKKDANTTRKLREYEVEDQDNEPEECDQNYGGYESEDGDVED